MWGTSLLITAVTAGFLGGGSASAVSNAQEVADGGLPFVAKVSFGDVRSCTGALINARWIVTAKDCFADAGGNVAAGVPTQSTTVVLGRADVTTDAGHKYVVTSIVPHPDRNIVLAELSAKVAGITPIPIAGSAPQADETLTVAGYGRTADEWVPNRMHSATFSVSSVTASQFEVLGSATLCRGDGGGPAFRETSSGSVELAGISDTSWQKGCIGETETRDGGYEARVDDLKDWITQSIAVQPADLKEPVLGEFTRDGFQDLIGIDSLGNGWLFPSTSASTWGNPIRLSSTWSGYRELTVARVNRDNYDDLLIINASGSLVVYYGAAGGLFSGAATLSTAFAGYRDLAVGNINNIGYDTLFAINSSTGVWYYFAGLAAGGFNMTAVQTGSGWGCCRQNTFGYFNNDSYLDLATIETSTGKLRIYPGNSTNGLGTGAVDEGAGATWGSATYIAAGKFDSTGLTGLLEVDSAGKLWLHARTAGGGWAARTALPGRSWGVQPGDMVQLVSGEFNRDGHPDLFGIDSSGSGWLFRSTSATTWAFGARQSSTWGGWRDMVVGRVNRDDYDDLLMITSAGALVQYNGVAAGGVTAIGTINSSFSDYRDLSIAKINNFTYDTLFGIKNSTGQWFYFPAVAAGGFNLTAPVQTGSGWGCCKLNTFGKFNNDNYVDLATVEVSTGKLRIYPGNSTNGLGTGAVDENAGAAWLSQDVAAIHSEVTGRDSILAKALPTGNLNLYPSIPNGGIDWADPIVYGTRY